MYNKVAKDLNFPAREKEIAQLWKDKDIVRRSFHFRDGAKRLTFFDGPPTANGRPHIGHIETRVIKDLIPRYWTMKGYSVLRKAGWDTHGLPVELEVEKTLGLDGKPQIEQYGIEPFIKECKKSVWKYLHDWEVMSDQVGYWVDMEHPYITYENDYIESEWWSLKEIWKKGLLYQGHKIVPYCPRCGTALSSHEVAQGYKTVKETSAYVRFPVKGEENTYLLAWTTTPWTLPSNMALCVNPTDIYCRFKAEDGRVYIMAKALMETVFPEQKFEVLAEMPGTALKGMEYVPLFDFAVGKLDKKAWFVICDNYVTMSDGTGIVHIAPAFGEDDNRVCRENDVPFVNFVDPQGCMTAETKWPGVFVKKADPLVLADLQERGLLFSAPQFTHDYPFCWRCDTPLLYYARESWFIKMTAVKDDLIRNNNTINWIPESIGKGRFGDWLENIQDWGLSRNRYWGTPLNIWECECGERHAVGSIKELKEMSDDCPENIELHRPFIDAVTIRCPKCGKKMHRVPEVIDCWFDSGSMPFAQHHYPFENKELFEAQFPADFISEAVDQTRGWFYSLHAISTLMFNRACFKNVIVLGHVQDENGQKMSKSKGNAVDPFEALETYGADAIRWYFYINSAPWLPNRFHGKAVVEGQRKFIGTLWNTYAFFVLYANIDNFDATKYTLNPDDLTVMDRWLLSRLYSTVQAVDDHLANYRIPEAAKALQGFVDEMSNWYVRRGRERYWAPGMEADKVAAYMTLYTALVTIAKAAAPMVPFLAEAIYQNLVRSIDKTAPESIHLCDFPTVEEKWIDKELESKMDEIIRIEELGRAARNGANRKNRQPLAEMYVKADKDLDGFYMDIIREELNIKEVIFTKEVEGFVSYNFKPQLKTVGPKYGKQLGKIREALAGLDGRAAKAILDSEGKLSFDFGEGPVELTADDLLIETTQREGFYTVSDRDITVAIDTVLTPALIEEGFMREIISKVQTMRKEAGFEVTDHIRITMEGSEKVTAVAEARKAEITSATLAESLTVGTPVGYTKEWDLNGEKATLGVEKI